MEKWNQQKFSLSNHHLCIPPSILPMKLVLRGVTQNKQTAFLLQKCMAYQSCHLVSCLWSLASWPVRETFHIYPSYTSNLYLAYPHQFPWGRTKQVIIPWIQAKLSFSPYKNGEIKSYYLLFMILMVKLGYFTVYMHTHMKYCIS